LQRSDPAFFMGVSLRVVAACNYLRNISASALAKRAKTPAQTAVVRSLSERHHLTVLLKEI
jgi:hypothetical protein